MENHYNILDVRNSLWQYFDSARCWGFSGGHTEALASFSISFFIFSALVTVAIFVYFSLRIYFDARCYKNRFKTRFRVLFSVGRIISELSFSFVMFRVISSAALRLGGRSILRHIATPCQAAAAQCSAQALTRVKLALPMAIYGLQLYNRPSGPTIQSLYS